MNAQGPPSILEAYCGMLNKAEEWIFDAKTAHIPQPPKNPRKLVVKVPVPGEAIQAIVIFHHCRSCTLICGMEDGWEGPCPYCGGELMQMEGE